MCGIAGIVDLKSRAVDASLVKRMCDRLGHRGPDAEGFATLQPAVLGQRRLSIIDLAHGKQPMGNEDGTVWVTFNGEIYNFQELREELKEQGHRFQTESDTEVIVHAYEEYGDECVSRFRGMFAFAIWDSKRRTLFLARDRVGKKPLFYTEVDGQFAFASELQGLLAHPAVSKELDPSALDDYLTYGYVPAPKSIFQNIFKLPPACSLTLTLPADAARSPKRQIQRYWRLEYTPKQRMDEAEALDGLLNVLDEAVRLRMIADVPLGALLSGGIDSSLVVALMSAHSSQPIKTFSIGFDDKAFNELPYARLVAQRYGTDHHELIVKPRAAEVLPTLVRHYGEPFADSSAIPSYYVAQLTRQHVTVALNGDGGDESFAGYERYFGSALAELYCRTPRVVRSGVVAPLSRLVPESLPARNRLRQAKRFIEAASQPFGARYLHWMSYFRSADKNSLYCEAFRERLNGYSASSWLQAQLEDVNQTSHEPLDRLLAVDVQSYLPYDLLVKMDIATMANSLEARSPFLDHKVMEFAARLPVRLKLRGRSLKHLLKQAARRLLPAQCIDRRKMGFGVPVGAWMRGELRPMVEDLLLSKTTLSAAHFRPERLQVIAREHFSGPQQFTSQLWALVWLELWQRELLS
jgi:asparagine synthase (glutamine-hydrolysing)